METPNEDTTVTSSPRMSLEGVHEENESEANSNRVGTRLEGVALENREEDLYQQSEEDSHSESNEEEGVCSDSELGDALANEDANQASAPQDLEDAQRLIQQQLRSMGLSVPNNMADLNAVQSQLPVEYLESLTSMRTEDLMDVPQRRRAAAPMTLREALANTGPSQHRDLPPLPTESGREEETTFTSSSMSRPTRGHRAVSDTTANSRERSEISSSSQGDLPPIPPRYTRIPSQPRHRSYRSLHDTDYRADRVVLPRWQPDSEVDKCPICGVHFSFFVRKHHCRKCGRVVCNSCSPHRITIPYAYIVRPPGVLPGFRAEDLYNSDSEENYAGGESVRLCNPCVPDPQIEPRPTLHSRPSRDSRHTISSPHPPDSFYGALFLPGETRATVFPQSSPGQQGQGSRSFRSGSLREQSHQASGHIYSSEHQQAGAASSSRRRPSQRSRNSDASLRAARIPVDANAFYGFGQLHASSNRRVEGDSSNQARRDATEPQPPLRIDLDDFGDLVLTYDATVRDTAAGKNAGEGSEKSEHGQSAADQQAECIICLEEFEVGTKIALMQCLCKFHASCLEDWWQIKPRCCPLHDHDK